MKLLMILATIVGLSLQIQAHAIIEPALGIPSNRAATRNDVQRPSSSAPCGKVDVNATLASATPVMVNADGTFVVNVTNFNGGEDGSRQVTAEVDATALGKTFIAMAVTQNGDLAPASVGTQAVTVKLPDSIECAGGSSKDICLISFKTASGFGNCVVAQQSLAPSTAESVSDAGGPSVCNSAPQDKVQISVREAINSAASTRRARAYRRLIARIVGAQESEAVDCNERVQY